MDDQPTPIEVTDENAMQASLDQAKAIANLIIEKIVSRGAERLSIDELSLAAGVYAQIAQIEAICELAVQATCIAGYLESITNHLERIADKLDAVVTETWDGDACIRTYRVRQ